MQVTTLLNPGQNPLTQSIRKEVARVISQLEIADVTGTPEPLFAAFLADAAAKTPGYAGPVLPATQAIVSSGGTVNVENSAGALDSPATAVVAGGVLTGVNLAATKTIVTHAQTINVENSAGALDSPATAVVAAGVITGVNLAATKSIVDNAGTYSVKNSAGTKTVVGTATVAAGVITGIACPANEAIVADGGAAIVQNSAGTAIPGTHPRAVSLGVENNVKLASTVGVVVNGVKQSGWTVTGSGTFFTPTIVAGVCTGGVLSAS